MKKVLTQHFLSDLSSTLGASWRPNPLFPILCSIPFKMMCVKGVCVRLYWPLVGRLKLPAWFLCFKNSHFSIRFGCKGLNKTTNFSRIYLKPHKSLYFFSLGHIKSNLAQICIFAIVQLTHSRLMRPFAPYAISYQFLASTSIILNEKPVKFFFLKKRAFFTTY